MICPLCKNEKLDEDLCPSCGRDGKTALLEAAAKFKNDRQWGRAAECFRLYLREDPGDLARLKELAFCSWQEALLSGAPAAVQRAKEDSVRALSGDWSWEEGHQYRVSLAAQGGDLTVLKEEYGLVARENPSRREVAEKVLKVIGLTEHFTRRMPEVKTPIPGLRNWKFLWVPTWPLTAGALLTAAFSVFVSNEDHPPRTFFTLLSFLLITDFSLFVFSFYLYRKVKSKGRERDHEKNTRPPGFTGLSDRDRE